MARKGALALALLVVGRTAAAQPSDPYGDPPDASAPGADPVLAEQIAEQLVARAQELLDARLFLDAKQLAIESLAKSPKGNSAERARYIIRVVNQQLGIKDEPAPPVVTPPSVDTAPITDPTLNLPTPKPIVERRVESAIDEVRDGKTAARVYGGIYGGIVGAAIGSFFSKDKPAAGAVPTGIVFAVGGTLAAPYLFGKKLHWDEAQVRTIGAGITWGGVAGGMLGDVVSGANEGTPTASSVLVGASLGATAGALAFGLLADQKKFTRGDVALVDTFAGMGAVGGLTIGMLMQPAQKEAYALNSALGTAGGALVGYVAAPQTNTTPRRMLRVAGLAAAGGALPFLLYAGIRDKSKDGDERITGALSSIGLVGGAWLGFYLTRDMDVDRDVPDGKAATPESTPPPGVVMRASDGTLSLGGLALQPLSPELAPQRGMALSVFAGSW